MGSYGGAYYGVSYYLENGDVDAKNLKQLCDHFYTTSYPYNAAFWQQAAIDKRFEAGDQTLWSMLYGDNQYFQSRRFFFNLIRRHTSMVGGYQRAHRKSTIALPLHDSDQLADDLNEVFKWCDERDGFHEYYSQAFSGSIGTGMSLLHMYLDYSRDPINGDLCTDNVAAFNFLCDPWWRKMDFTDLNFLWRRRWVSNQMAQSLLPERAKEIAKMKSIGVKDGRFPLQAELINISSNQLLAYDEIHYRAQREATMIIDPKSGESMEWEEQPGDEPDLMKRVLAEQPWLVVKKMQIPTVKLIIMIGNQPMYHGPNLLGVDRYPFVPMVCYHEPDIQSYAWRLQGMVRNLRDSQYLYNLRKVIEMDLLQSQVQNAWIYPVDVVTDPKAFRQTQNGCLIPLKKGHLPNEIQRLDPQGIPQSVLELSRALSEDITKISGVNEELLGAATDDKAGILSMLRQSAGLVTLNPIFDKADYSQRLYGQLRLEAVRKNFSVGKVRSILKREPHPDFFSGKALKYSIQVEEGNYSTTQRQMELQQLLHFRELGMPIQDKDILNAAFITNKKSIIENMQQSTQQQQEVQAAQMEQQNKKDNADVMVKFAKARSDMAKTHELEASAEHKKTEADLNLVKELITLEDMDLQNFRNALELAQAIKAANEPQLAVETA